MSHGDSSETSAGEREGERERVTYIGVGPYPWLAHRRDEVGAREEQDADVALLAVCGLDAAELGVDLVIKMVEHNRGPLVVLVSLPSVDHEP